MTAPATVPTAFSELLEQRASAWLEAATDRHSRRSFDGVPVSPELLATFAETCARFAPFPDARVVFVPQPPEGLFTSVLGSYGRVSGAPHALAVIADTAAPWAQWHAGYTGQAAILEAAALGLDTCWVAGLFSAKAAVGLTELGDTERVLAVSPVGYSPAHKNLNERLMSGMARSHRRIDAQVIAPDMDDAWPTWARAAVDAVRIAPSAMNRQPWRLRMDDGALVIARDTTSEAPKVTKALDCGIAALHAQIAARGQGVAGRWTDVTGARDVARFEPDAL